AQLTRSRAKRIFRWYRSRRAGQDDHDLSSRRRMGVVRHKLVYRSPTNLLVLLGQLPGHRAASRRTTPLRNLSQSIGHPAGRFIQYGRVRQRAEGIEQLSTLATFARREAEEGEAI